MNQNQIRDIINLVTKAREQGIQTESYTIRDISMQLCEARKKQYDPNADWIDDYQTWCKANEKNRRIIQEQKSILALCEQLPPNEQDLQFLMTSEMWAKLCLSTSLTDPNLTEAKQRIADQQRTVRTLSKDPFGDPDTEQKTSNVLNDYLILSEMRKQNPNADLSEDIDRLQNQLDAYGTPERITFLHKIDASLFRDQFSDVNLIKLHYKDKNNVPQIQGIWMEPKRPCSEIRFPGAFHGHMFTDTEANCLLHGESILTCLPNGEQIAGKLERKDTKTAAFVPHDEYRNVKDRYTKLAENRFSMTTDEPSFTPEY